MECVCVWGGPVFLGVLWRKWKSVRQWRAGIPHETCFIITMIAAVIQARSVQIPVTVESQHYQHHLKADRVCLL